MRRQWAAAGGRWRVPTAERGAKDGMSALGMQPRKLKSNTLGLTELARLEDLFLSSFEDAVDKGIPEDAVGLKRLRHDLESILTEANKRTKLLAIELTKIYDMVLSSARVRAARQPRIRSVRAPSSGVRIPRRRAGTGVLAPATRELAGGGCPGKLRTVWTGGKRAGVGRAGCPWRQSGAPHIATKSLSSGQSRETPHGVTVLAHKCSHSPPRCGTDDDRVCSVAGRGSAGD